MAGQRPIVFISCGQWTDEEKQLGRQICELTAELRKDVEPYFAEYQSTVEGLSGGILNALKSSCGLICVMHDRGTISTPEGKQLTRGSVWIEQEIAIAAFMEHALGKSTPVLFYKQTGVGLEGIRQSLLMNPLVEFTDGAQVLADLRDRLPTFSFRPIHEYALQPVVRCENVAIRSERHDYRFFVGAQNVGKQRITDFRLSVFFPEQFLEGYINSVAYTDARSTRTHRCFEADQKRAPKGLYAGDCVPMPLSIDFFIDDRVFRDAAAMASKIIVEVDSGSMDRVREEYPIAQYTKF